MQGERTVGRHIVRKFLANVLLVIAVAWLVAGMFRTSKALNQKLGYMFSLSDDE